MGEQQDNYSRDADKLQGVDRGTTFNSDYHYPADGCVSVIQEGTDFRECGGSGRDDHDDVDVCFVLGYDLHIP